ncbi:unnamed protein product, partial [Effrenium voratum]
MIRGFRGVRSESRGPRLARLARRAAEEQPGISWIKLDRSSQTEAAEPTGDRSVLPLFPMSGAYFPHAQPELSIFEPRYRQLYNDILVSGSRRFVVATPNPDADSIAEVGVVFYLDDLTDVSEESGDEVKYVCSHRVLGRVRILKVLNPEVWKDASTYLRAEVVDYEDDGEVSDEDTEEEQEEVMELLRRVARRQEEIGGPHFESHISDYANASVSENGGLWTLADVLAEYYEYLTSEKEQTLDLDIEQVYYKYGLEDGEDEEEEFRNFMAAAEGNEQRGYSTSYEDDGDDDYEEVDLAELPAKARSELFRLQEQFEEEAAVLHGDLMEFVQAMLRSTCHRQRLRIMRDALAMEERRLAARRALQM